MKCDICGTDMTGVVTFDPVDGRELNRLECCGPLRHMRPWNANLPDVMEFRARVSRMLAMEVTVCVS